MKISVKWHKRVRFYTSMISSGAFLMLAFKNGWINAPTLLNYTILAVILIAILIAVACGAAWVMRFLLDRRK